MAEDHYKKKFIALASDGKPRTIHFASTHNSALKPTPDKKYIARLSVPFENSIRIVLYSETKLGLIKSKYPGWWLPLNNTQEYAKVSDFVTKHATTVFIRDLLPVSCALDKNFIVPEPHTTSEVEYTELGRLEYRAKYKADEDAISQLAAKATGFIGSTVYKKASVIIGVPASKTGETSLPQRIAQLVANKAGLFDASNTVQWCKTKPSLKDKSMEEKWETLMSVGICVSSPDALIGKHVILFDDLYQSGATLNFLAGALLNVGVRLVYGLALVKSLSNSDNM